ncbi:MAG TPA: sensor histidine kinase [Selenomonadales bacterium]|nr:sensor histidine kinase [Selenomonadales bacterium]
MNFRLNSLRKKCLAATIIGFIIPYLISSIFVTNLVRNKVEDDFISLSDEQLEKVYFTLYESILDPAYRAIVALANDDETKALVPLIGQSTQNSDIPADAYKGLQLFFKTQKNLSGIGIGTEAGGYFVYPEVVGRNSDYDPRDRAWYSDTLLKRAPVFTEPYIRANGRLTIAIAQTITTTGDQPVGVVVFGWDLQDFQARIQGLRIGSSGFLMVLDAENHIIVSPANSGWLSKTPDELGLADLRNLEDKTSGIHQVNITGKPQYMRVKVSDSGWKIVSLIDTQELALEIFDFFIVIVSVYFLTFLISIAIILYMAKRLTSSVESLSNAAGAFAKGQTNVQVDIRTDDEIGFLAKTFNEMVMHIEERNRDISRLNSLNIIGETAAGIAHEVRNPMTAVRGYLQFLARKEAKFSSQFQLMIEELDRANLIITGFLSLAKNKAIALKPTDLNGIIQLLYPLLEADAVGTNKIVKLELAPLPPLLVDENEIRQLVLNLARNGLEAMDSGKTLTIRTCVREAEAVLVIKDQGKGIDPKIIEKIGLPFMTTKESGTGLGLAVCYSIVSRHKGRITVDTDSAGTTFSVFFKLTDGQAPA